MKRLLAFVLSFCLILSCLPFGAIALEQEQEIATEPQVAPQPEEETQAPSEEVPAQADKEAPVVNESTHTHGACICAVTGSTCSHEQLSWTAWESADSLPTEAGNYYLTQKVTLAALTTINANVNICLNGFDVDLNQKRIVVSGGSLTIMNCQAQLNSKNQLTSTAGKVYNGASTNNSNSGINYMGGAIGTKAPLTLIAIHLDNNLCKQASDARSGGAIYAEHTTVVMESCSFKNNKSDGTGGVFASYGGSLTVNNCLFTNNHAVKRGGAIAVNTSGASGATNLTVGGNSEFTGNYTSSTGSTVFYGAGGAIFAFKNGTTALNVTINGNTKITGNTASQEGGGLCIRNKTASSATNLTISGNVQISGNAGEESYDNLYFDNSAADSAQKVTLGNLGANANVKVNLKSEAADPDAVLAAAGGASFQEAATIGVYVDDKAVAYSATELFYYPGHAHQACVCAITGNDCGDHGAAAIWTAWESADSLPTEPGNYYLTQKVTLAGNVVMNGKVNICLNGFDIDMAQKHIESGNGDDVTIMNCQATLNAKGQLEEGNAKITNGKHTHGAVAYVAAGGKLTTIGVEFCKNTNYRSGTLPGGQGGGALYTEGELNVYACRFVDNTSNNCGGAIAAYVTGNVKIDDCYFSGNSAVSGGAVSVFSGGSTTSNVAAVITGDCEFVENEATGNGGALYSWRHSNTKEQYAPRLVLDGNINITGNTAKIGGAVYMNAKGTTLEVAGNVKITGNTGSTKADNVYLWDLNTHKVVVGKLGANASIGIFTGDNFTTASEEPDGFLSIASGVSLSDTENTGLFWDREDPAKTIGYNATDKFYYVTEPVAAHENHGVCICAVSGATCSHEQLTWTAWESTTSLPTEPGNYYLTGKVTVDANVFMNGKVNICLNGFSIDMNEKRIEAGNGDDVTILNCQATLNAKGQLEEGNAKITNGKHTHGAAVSIPAGGKFTAIGVEFADNNNYRESPPPSGQGGGAVYIEGVGEFYACRFVDNTSNNCGGAIAVYVTGSVKVDDCYFSGNSANNGGALSVYTGGNSTTNVIATLTGDNEFVDNEGNNGGALYVRRHANTPAGYTAKIILKDNCTITGNNATNNGGAIYFEGADAALEIWDNAQIADNTAAKKGPNVYLWDVAHKITVGQIGEGLSVGVFTGDNIAAADPDEFMQLASGVTMADTENTGFFFEKTEPELVIGYNAADKFYFVDDTVYDHDDHGLCICSVAGSTCSHSALTWKPWKSKTSLPTTAGNYFLTADVTLAAITDITADVNICLNGYNINLSGKKIHSTASLGIVNCQATVNDKNQLTSTTGKIYGGDGTSYGNQQYGGAISTFGELTLIGVWFADNSAKGADARTGGALYVDDKASATVISCKFTGNQALSSSSTNKNNGVGGAISVYKGGSLSITDSVFQNNTADLYGGAIAVNNRYATADAAVTISGNCEFTGNKTNSTSDGFGSALYLYARSEDGGKLNVTLSGNTKITGNTAAKYGAVYLRTHDKAPELNFVVSDNVSICDNTASTEQSANVYMHTMKQKIRVGQLGADVRVFVGTPSGVGDPDEFMTESSGVSLQNMDITGFFYANKSPAISIGHSTDDAIDFYFDMAAAQAHKDHSLCDCFLSGETCTDATLTWKAWIYDDQLPTTAGNWYLTCDVKVTDTTSVKVAGVNLCLNGYNIDLNEKYIGVSGAGEMGIINCKAVAKANGQLDETKSVGGKITNGKHTHGAAFSISAGADLTAIGVEFYKNNNFREGTVYEGQGGGAIHNEGVAELYSCRFIENTTNNCGGAMVLYSTGSAVINDCYFSGNTAVKQAGALSIFTGGNSQDDVVATLTGDNTFVGNTTEGSGGAIYIKRHANTKAGINPKLDAMGNVTVTENTAAKDGGGIAIIGTTTDFRTDLNGTVISKNKANRGGGIYVEKAKLVGTTITVSDNSAVGTGSSGGGIVGMGAIISLQTNTQVTGNKTEKGGGGGIYVSNASTLNLYGCTVSKNESPDGGGVRLWRESVLNLKGGKINNNKSTASGGGVSLVKGSILNMEDGEISKNTCEKNGGGIYCDNYFQSSDTTDYDLPQLNLMGGTVSGNTIKGSYGGGIYAKNCKTKISGTVITKNTGKTANGGGIYVSNVVVTEETEVNGEIVITEFEFEPTFEMTGGEVSENKSKNGGGIYFSSVDATISGGTIKKNTASENAGGMSVRSAKLTFKNNAEVSNNTGKSGGGIILQVDSTMDMLGGTVKGNSARNGGGILLWSRSVLNMRGGRINSNSATKGSGGGIFAQGGAKVNLSGGTVGYNTAKSNGGGIYVTVVDKDTTVARLTQTGGLVIGNEGNQGGGGYLNKGAIGNFYGGTWKENETKVCGGAMYINASVANFYGGTFTKNHAVDCGGAINGKTAKILVDGAEFVENISEARGGAFRLHTDCEFTMKSGKINDNEAARAGGAIGLFNSKTFTMEGGEICGNKVTGSELYPDPIGGGAINVAEASNVYSQYDTEMNITGGKIAENYSMTDGGAIFLSSRAVLNISGGEIVNNKAGENGGAIIVDPIHSNSRTARATLNVTGGKLSGNTAVNGGAIYAVTTSKVVLDGATIDGNTASDMGGAVYMGKGTNTTFKDAVLKNNKAANAAGFYVADDFVMQNLEVTGNDAGSGYAAYIDKGEFDGRSYVLSIIKMGGDIRICDNHGDNADLFIGENAKINIAKEGLGKNTKIDLELASGVLTNTIIGAYNYEGGNLLYTVTYGDRSMTDLEPIPTEAAEEVPEQTQPATEPGQAEPAPAETSIVLPIAVGAGALAIVAIVLILLLKRKNGKKH